MRLPLAAVVLVAVLCSLVGCGTATVPSTPSITVLEPVPQVVVAGERLVPAAGDTRHAAPGVSHDADTSGAPVRVRIPSLGIDAPIDPVGIIDGTLAIPDDIDRAGWDRLGMPAGALTGTTLIAGHRDNIGGALGALAPIERAQRGALIEVSVRGGGAVVYRVVAVEVYGKRALPGRVVASTGAHRLALVTCAGPIVRGRYTRNVVVWAAPVR